MYSMGGVTYYCTKALLYIFITDSLTNNVQNPLKGPPHLPPLNDGGFAYIVVAHIRQGQRGLAPHPAPKHRTHTC